MPIWAVIQLEEESELPATATEVPQGSTGRVGRSDPATDRITPEGIDPYLAAKVRQGLSPKTVNNHLLTLRVMLK